MIKKTVPILFIVMLILASCGQNEEPAVNPGVDDSMSVDTSTTDSPAVSDVSSYDAMYYQYLWEGLDKTGIYQTSWNEAKEIRPDDFVTFFSAKTGLYRVITDAGMEIPAETYERYIQLYFDVDSEKLQKTRYYNPSDNTYTINILDGWPPPRVIDAVTDGDILTLTINYSVSATEGSKENTSRLEIELMESNKYRYLSCSADETAVNDAGDIPDYVLEENEEYRKTYLEAAVQSGITSYTWTDASQLPPDCFVDYYMVYTDRVNSAGEPVSAGELESLVQQHFVVDSDSIRASKYYDAVSQTYSLSEPEDKPAMVTSASSFNNKVTIYYECYDPSDGTTLIRDGILHITTGEDGSFIYTSCQMTDLT